MAETLTKMNNEAEERAADREERLRLKELEMEERRVEREMRHEERMFTMLAAVLERTSANQMFSPYLPPMSGRSPRQASSASSGIQSSQHIPPSHPHDDQ